MTEEEEAKARALEEEKGSVTLIPSMALHLTPQPPASLIHLMPLHCWFFFSYLSSAQAPGASLMNEKSPASQSQQPLGLQLLALARLFPRREQGFKVRLMPADLESFSCFPTGLPSKAQ